MRMDAASLQTTMDLFSACCLPGKCPSDKLMATNGTRERLQKDIRQRFEAVGVVCSGSTEAKRVRIKPRAIGKKQQVSPMRVGMYIYIYTYDYRISVYIIYTCIYLYIYNMYIYNVYIYMKHW